MANQDFTKIGINNWSVQMNGLDDILPHLTFIVDVLNWIIEKGVDILVDGAKTYQEWEGLLEKAFWLLRDFPQTRSVATLFAEVVEEGVRSLRDSVCTIGSDQKTQEAWLKSLLYQLQPGARCGLGSSVCSAEKTREMLNWLVQVAQHLKSEHYLRVIAAYRIDDPECMELYVSKHKNW